MGCTGSRYRQNENQKANLSLKECTTQPVILKGCIQKLGLSYVATSIMGWREYNEDSFIAEQINSDTMVFGVFDGHSGAQISVFAQKNFASILKQNGNFKNQNYEKALQESFMTLDEMLITEIGQKQLIEIEKHLKGLDCYRNSGNSQYLAGSTAVVILVTNKYIYVANAGDSKAIIVHQNKIVLQTIDHRPDNPTQKQRIMKNGGFIMNGRIFGDLNVSRGFGDYAHKAGTNPLNYIISAAPQIYKIEKSKADSILLGSDGIWQKPTHEVWSEFIRYKVQKNNPQSSIVDMLESAIADYFSANIGKNRFDIKGTDNMTAVLIKLQTDSITSSASN